MPNPFGNYNQSVSNPFDVEVKVNKPWYSEFTDTQYDPQKFIRAIHSGQPIDEEGEVEEVVQEAAQELREEGNENPTPHEIATKARQVANRKWGYDPKKKQSLEDFFKGGGILGGLLSALTGGKDEPIGDWRTRRGISSSEYYDVYNKLGVNPTGSPGRGLGDYDPFSGGIYNQSGIATDPESGFATGVGGNASYASLDDWNKVRAAGNASGWRGGFLTQSGYNSLSAQGRANYQSFLDAYNTANGTYHAVTVDSEGNASQTNTQPPVQGESISHTTHLTQDDDGDESYSGNSYSINEVNQELDRARDAGQAPSDGYGGGSFGGLNKGGPVMYKNYGGMIPVMMQQGGFAADDGSDFAEPAAIGGEPVAPTADPMMDPMAAPAPAPQMPMMQEPMEEPEEDFWDKVMKAKKAIKGQQLMPEMDSMMPMSSVANEPMVDETVHPGMPQGQDTVPAWLTPGEYVVNAEAMEDPVNAATVDAINEEGREIQMMRRGGMMMNRGGSTYDRQRFIRKLLEEVKPGSRDEAILLKKLGIDPTTKKNYGGMIPMMNHGGQVDKIQRLLESPNLSEATRQKLMGMMPQYRQEGGGIHNLLSSPGAGEVGKFIYKSAFNDPNAIDAFSDPKRTGTDDPKAFAESYQDPQTGAIYSKNSKGQWVSQGQVVQLAPEVEARLVFLKSEESLRVHSGKIDENARAEALKIYGKDAGTFNTAIGSQIPDARETITIANKIKGILDTQSGKNIMTVFSKVSDEGRAGDGILGATLDAFDSLTENLGSAIGAGAAGAFDFAAGAINEGSYRASLNDTDYAKYQELKSLLSRLFVKARKALQGQGQVTEREAQVVYDSVGNLGATGATWGAMQTNMDFILILAKAKIEQAKAWREFKAQAGGIHRVDLADWALNWDAQAERYFANNQVGQYEEPLASQHLEDRSVDQQQSADIAQQETTSQTQEGGANVIDDVGATISGFFN